jgi:hypothetical protein
VPKISVDKVQEKKTAAVYYKPSSEPYNVELNDSLLSNEKFKRNNPQKV